MGFSRVALEEHWKSIEAKRIYFALCSSVFKNRVFLTEKIGFFFEDEELEKEIINLFETKLKMGFLIGGMFSIFSSKIKVILMPFWTAKNHQKIVLMWC